MRWSCSIWFRMPKLKLNPWSCLCRIELNSLCCFVSQKRRRKRGNEKATVKEKKMRRKSKGNGQKTRRKRRGQKEMKLFNLVPPTQTWKLKLNSWSLLHRIELNSLCCFVSWKRKRKREGNEKEMRRKRREREMKLFNFSCFKGDEAVQFGRKCANWNWTLYFAYTESNWTAFVALSVGKGEGNEKRRQQEGKERRKPERNEKGIEKETDRRRVWPNVQTETERFIFVTLNRTEQLLLIRRSEKEKETRRKRRGHEMKLFNSKCVTGDEAVQFGSECSNWNWTLDLGYAGSNWTGFVGLKRRRKREGNEKMRRQEGTEKKMRRKSKAVHFGSKCANWNWTLHFGYTESNWTAFVALSVGKGEVKATGRKGEGKVKETRRKWEQNRKETDRKREGNKEVQGDETVQCGSTHPNVQTKTEHFILITRNRAFVASPVNVQVGTYSLVNVNEMQP